MLTRVKNKKDNKRPSNIIGYNKHDDAIVVFQNIKDLHVDEGELCFSENGKEYIYLGNSIDGYSEMYGNAPDIAHYRILSDNDFKDSGYSDEFSVENTIEIDSYGEEDEDDIGLEELFRLNKPFMRVYRTRRPTTRFGIIEGHSWGRFGQNGGYPTCGAGYCGGSSSRRGGCGGYPSCGGGGC